MRSLTLALLLQIVIMCHRMTCPNDGKPTWWGCGYHVESVSAWACWLGRVLDGRREARGRGGERGGGVRDGGGYGSVLLWKRRRLTASIQLPHLKPAEEDGESKHSPQVLKDVPVEERCTCEHTPIVNLPGVKIMKTVKKREPGMKAVDSSSVTRDGL